MPELSALSHVKEDSAETKRRMDICAGGLIEQPIAIDPGIYEWGDSPIGTRRVRIVDFAEFKRLTGSLAPELPQLPVSYDEPEEWRQEDSTQIKSLAGAIHDIQLKQRPERSEHSSHFLQHGREVDSHKLSEPSNSPPQFLIGTADSGSDEKPRKGIRRLFWRKKGEEARTGQPSNTGAKSRTGFWSNFACWKE
ncbi:hypothetical protein BDZ45DRAFT_477846 [Acephala macrosclerotiorum]|nr:hypothetical protein BDZ45DRAFT_477846 [Acephala macrosclerotiorum]